MERRKSGIKRWRDTHFWSGLAAKRRILRSFHLTANIQQLVKYAAFPTSAWASLSCPELLSENNVAGEVVLERRLLVKRGNIISCTRNNKRNVCALLEIRICILNKILCAEIVSFYFILLSLTVNFNLECKTVQLFLQGRRQKVKVKVKRRKLPHFLGRETILRSVN